MRANVVSTDLSFCAPRFTARKMSREENVYMARLAEQAERYEGKKKIQRPDGRTGRRKKLGAAAMWAGDEENGVWDDDECGRGRRRK